MAQAGEDGMESDTQLLDRYAAGEEPAFEELVRRHKKTIYDLAYRMLENHADAADMAQKTFVQAFLHHRSFKRESTFRTWLYQIGLNLCRNAIRDRARLAHEDVEEVTLTAPHDTFAEVANGELKDRLGEAIRTLPTRQREALVLRVYHNHAFAEIGTIMSCSEGTAKANYHHAVDNLRRILVAGEGIP
jgi:RNA polymerase sigma-70 factor (ECF subfamily)